MKLLQEPYDTFLIGSSVYTFINAPQWVTTNSLSKSPFKGDVVYCFFGNALA